ncbi:hypothetical protein [Roseateles violae]|uniref:Uncharacterized protein n=1 Tax=Roseateles violae TaxID=3058042 RepID=A0ABT8DQ32_9BURK|nr:hypothetical protein [Pelomonas sp. PFR6]MDN3920123.1 hypothetical protein [Pelomonas sp. PFR6]
MSTASKPDLRSARRLAWLLPAAAIAVFLASLLLAWWKHDAHWVQRGGALISALAAAAILLQILHEMRLEESRHEIETQGAQEQGEAIGPIDALATRIAGRQRERAIEELKRSRLRIAGYVVGCAIAGELLHGFGDLIAHGLLGLGH